MQEAEAAIGDKALTAAEALWFRYTAGVPDSWLFFLNIPFIFIIFHAFSIPALLLDVLARSTFPWLRRYKLQPDSFLDAASLWRCYSNVMLSYISVILPLIFFCNPIFKFIGIRTSLPLPSVTEIFAQLFVYSVVEDYLGYWLHRGFHTDWAYKNCHYKHHEYSPVTSMCGPYADWFEMAVSTLPSFLGPAVVPGHIVTLWLWFALRQLIDLDGHIGYELPWAPTKLIPFYVSPEYHDHHHQVGGKSQGNFANIFTYCDSIYGTNKGYHYKKRMEVARKKNN